MGMLDAMVRNSPGLVKSTPVAKGGGGNVDPVTITGILSAVAPLAQGLLGGGGGGGVKVSTDVQQTAAQVASVVTSPVIQVSSPSSTIEPATDAGAVSGSPVSQSTSTSQVDTPASQQSLIPSLFIPSGDATGVTAATVASPESSILDNPILLIGLAAAAVFLLARGV